METLSTPNHRPTPACHHRFRSTHFGPHAGWEPDGIHREQPGRGQIVYCGSLPGCTTCLPLRQLSDIVGGLNHLHLYDVIHGDHKGVSGYSGSCSTTVLMHNQSDILVDAVGRGRITNYGLSGVPLTSTGTVHDGLGRRSWTSVRCIAKRRSPHLRWSQSRSAADILHIRCSRGCH